MNYTKEVFNKKIEDNFDRKLDLNLLMKKSSAKTPAGLILGMAQKFKNDKNFEMALFCQELYKKIYALEKKRTTPLIEVEVIDGWKSKDSLEIYNGLQNDIIINSHLKDKDTGEVKTSSHVIPHENINRILFWVKKWKIGESHKCYEFAKILGFNGWKDLWRERRDYFNLYYFPIKVLEALNLIEYSGRGEITRLK